jgi:hypothetical protein
MAKKVTFRQIVERVWDIDGYPNYFFGNDKQLYRTLPRAGVRRNKRIMIGSTMGYSLKSKFFSLSQLRPLLRRHEDSDHPMPF